MFVWFLEEILRIRWEVWLEVVAEWKGSMKRLKGQSTGDGVGMRPG